MYGSHIIIVVLLGITSMMLMYVYLRRRFSKNRRNFEELFVENKTRKLHILKIAI